MALPLIDQNILLDGVFNGGISLLELPLFLYEYTALELDTLLLQAFGNPSRFEPLEIEKVRNFKSNIGRFSGAKTFQEVRLLTEAVFDENGNKRAFSEFKTIGRAIDETYSSRYLKTEQNTVFAQAQNARSWLKFEREKDVLPVLQYVTVGDGRVRPSHQALNGFKAFVDDPVWRRIMPINAFGCRCIVIQRPMIPVTPERSRSQFLSEINIDFARDPAFEYNAGTSEYIFKEVGAGKHNYFLIPREFSTEFKRNFGFPTLN